MSQKQVLTHQHVSSAAADRAAGGALPAGGSSGGLRRVAIAVVIGLISAVALWIVTPYNNYLLNNSQIADDYLPLGAVVVIILLAIGLNPLLRAIRPRWALSGRQLGLIFAILLIASVVPGFGLMRAWPYMVARNPHAVNQRTLLAEEYKQRINPPRTIFGHEHRLPMFPDEIERGRNAPVGEKFMQRLDPAEPLPWRAWLGPIIFWGVFILFSWMMMIGLGAIVFPQWRDNERVAFPLLAVQQALIDEPQPGELLPPTLRSRTFWVIAGGVFFIHLLSGLNAYFPNSVPSIPLSWRSDGIFSSPPWNMFTGSVRDQRIFFSFIGLAFFMPSRIAFSIWFFIIVYAFYRMIGFSYLPPFHYNQMNDHRTGAMLAVAVGILWIGRSHWRKVAVCMFSRGKDEQTRHHRDSGWLLTVGMAGMALFMWFMGLSPGWSLLLVGFGFMCALLISRMLAETGMPLMRLHIDALYLVKLAPIRLLSPILLLLSQVIGVMFVMSSRVSASAMAVQAAAVTGEHRPRALNRLTWLFLIILVLGFFVSGTSHMVMNYNNDRTINEYAINGWGLGLLDGANTSIEEYARGNVGRQPHNVIGHIAFGAILAGLLYWLSMTVPTWPLHPIGLLLVNTTSYGNKVWASLFFGWLLKVLLVRFGGAMAYRRARPAFLGLIIGEVLAAVFWAIAQLGVINMNIPPQIIEVLP